MLLWLNTSWLIHKCLRAALQQPSRTAVQKSLNLLIENLWKDHVRRLMGITYQKCKTREDIAVVFCLCGTIAISIDTYYCNLIIWSWTATSPVMLFIIYYFIHQGEKNVHTKSVNDCNRKRITLVMSFYLFHIQHRCHVHIHKVGTNTERSMLSQKSQCPAPPTPN